MSLDALHELTVNALRAMADSLRDGALSQGISDRPLQQIVGSGSSHVRAALEALQAQSMSPQQIGLVVQAMLETRERVPDPSLVFELVLSGPSLHHIPTRHTSAVVRTLFAEAETEVIAAGYAIHNGKELFRPLHDRMLARPDLNVTLLLDVPRRNDHLTPQQTLDAFRKDFIERHWPWDELPSLYYFPLSMEDSHATRGSLHAKCVIVDGSTALVTSANFTESAQQRNIEAGVLSRYQPMIRRLRDYFLALMSAGKLSRLEIGPSP